MKFLNDNSLNYLVNKIDKIKHFWNNEERGTYKDSQNKESMDVLFKSNDAKLAKNNTIIARSLMVGKSDNQVLDVRTNNIKFFRNLGVNSGEINPVPIMKLQASNNGFLKLHNAGISLNGRTYIENREIRTYCTNSIVLGRQNTINNIDYYCGLKPNNNFTLMLSPKFYKKIGSFISENVPCITLNSADDAGHGWDKAIHLYPLGTDNYPYMELNGTRGNISIKAENLIDIDSDGSIDIGTENASTITIGDFTYNNKGICVDNYGRISIRSDDIHIYADKLNLDSRDGIVSIGWNAKEVTMGCNLEMQSGGSYIRTNTLFLKNKRINYYTDNSINHFIDYGLLDNLYRLAYIVKENFSYNKLSITLQHIKEINTQGVWNNNVYTYNGVTFTVNDDLTITATGTSTNNNCRIWIYDGQFSQPAGYDLYVTGCPRGGAQNKFYLNAYTIESGDDWWDVMDYGNKDDNCLLVGSNRIDTLRIFFNINSGVKVKNLIIAPMLVEKDEYRHLPYQQYGAVNNGIQSQIDTLINQLNNLSN